MRVTSSIVFVFAIVFPMLGTAAVKAIYGWVESVEIGPDRAVLLAKLDTGATTSSLDARDIQRFRRGGKRFVRFSIPDGEGKFDTRMERPLVRIVRIKRHDGDYQRRPVVTLSVCLGDMRREAEFTLVDRQNFDHPVLLGRNVLNGFALIDPELERTISPQCAAGTS